jgi:hypothetical protein
MWDPKRKKPADAGFFFSNLVEVAGVSLYAPNPLKLQQFI